MYQFVFMGNKSIIEFLIFQKNYQQVPLWPLQQCFSEHWNIIRRFKRCFSHFSIFINDLKKNFVVPFYGWDSTFSRLQSHYEETVYFLQLSPQEFLVLIWSTLEEWKAESNLEPPSDICPYSLRKVPYITMQMTAHCLSLQEMLRR